MKSARADGDLGEPERWTARAAPRGTAEGVAGAALRRARDATAPRDEDVARLDARLAARQVDRASSRWHWRLALALALLLATGGAVGAAGKLLRRMRSTPPAGAMSGHVSASRDAPARAGARNRRDGQGPAVAAPASPVATPTPEGSSSQGPASSPNAPASLSESPTAATAPPALVPSRAVGRHEASRSVTEARLLAAAFRALRAGHDPDAALRALDSYDRAFPRGALASEACIARVEALMSVGRRADALALLAALDGGGGTPTRNVLVMRGELFAEAGQCGNAVRDFDRILSAGARDDAEARALFGRAACRLRGRDTAAGERDLRRYLERYPNGAFAAAAREALHVAP